MSAASNNSFPPDVIAAALAAEKAYYPYGPFVSVSLAQWALESAYGRAEPSGSDNPFGIKAVAGQAAVVAWTHETLHGHYVEIQQRFAKYDSLDEAFMAHAKLLATAPCYHAAQHAQTADEYARALQGIYATGIPGHPYGDALIAIMRAANLYQYDRPTVVTTVASPPAPEQGRAAAPAPAVSAATFLAAAAGPAIPAANLNLDTMAGVCAALNRLGAAPPLPAPLPGQDVGGFSDAVAKFQAAHGCAVDGEYGPQTKRALKAALGLAA